MGKFIIFTFYSVESVLSLLHLRSKGFNNGGCVRKKSRGGTQAASESAEQETQKQEVSHWPFLLIPSLLSLFSLWMASRCTISLSQWLGRRCTGGIARLQTRHADVAVVEVQFVAALVWATAALLFHSQEEPFLQTFSARTKNADTEPDERCDRLCFILNDYSDQLPQDCSYSWKVCTEAAGASWNLVQVAKNTCEPDIFTGNDLVSSREKREAKCSVRWNVQVHVSVLKTTGS